MPKYNTEEDYVAGEPWYLRLFDKHGKLIGAILVGGILIAGIYLGARG